jgi:DNA modification methylase
MIISGDSIEELKRLEDNSVDSIVTDPPYGLSFMGKKWDYDVPSKELWQEAMRVLKPGGHLLSFAGSRTYHRMAVNIEDAGFEIRDQIMWVYGSGFPKSHNIGKAVDKIILRKGMFEPFAKHYETQRKNKGLTHNEICEIGKFYSNHNHGGASSNWSTGANVPTLEQYKILKPLLDLSDEFDGLIDRIEREREIIKTENVTARPGFSGDRFGEVGNTDYNYTKGNSEWEGWGTALKPAHEPIVVARKPLSEKSVAENVLKWGTGGINIDECRVETDEVRKGGATTNGNLGWKPSKEIYTNGRFPANFIHDGSDEVVELFPDKTGQLAGTTGKEPSASKKNAIYNDYSMVEGKPSQPKDQLGSASRFFYCAKASKSERNKGLEGFEEKLGGAMSGKEYREDRPPKHTMRANTHPTVKPVKLMQYLVRLVTPKNGIVLDPFMGSGTTGIACKKEGFDFIGIELDEDYCKIAEARINKVT